MGNFIVGIINALIEGLGVVLTAITYILPPSPFALIEMTPLEPYLEGLNYFLPISEIIVIGEAWLGAVTIFYGVQTVLRWIKQIGN